MISEGVSVTLSCWVGSNLVLASKTVSAEFYLSRYFEQQLWSISVLSVTESGVPTEEASDPAVMVSSSWGVFPSALGTSPLPGASRAGARPLWSCAMVQQVTGDLWGQWEWPSVVFGYKRGQVPWAEAEAQQHARADHLSVKTSKLQQRRRLSYSILGGQRSNFAAWQTLSACFQSLHINVLLCTRLKFHFCGDSTVQCTSGQIRIRAWGLFTECTYGIVFQILFCCSLKHCKS